MAANIEYKQNLTHVRNNCPCCKSIFKTFKGPWPFLAGTDIPVCQGCGEQEPARPALLQAA